LSGAGILGDIKARVSRMRGHLRFGSAPSAVDLKRRDPARALDFLRPPDLEGSAEGPSERFLAQVEERCRLAASEDLSVRVTGSSWYHTIELPGGLVTPGYYDHRELVAGYGFPPSMSGTRALDVATFDGFWAFEMEKRGASVTALDLANSLEIDMPPQARARALVEQLGVPVGTGFAIASEALRSGVERREGSVYTLTPNEWGYFDYVHVGDLLLHLERPLEALRRIQSVTAGTLHISDTYDPSLPAETVRYLGGWSDAIWWIPSLDTLCQWIADAGFEDVQVIGTYQLDVSTTNATGYWRAIIKAQSEPPERLPSLPDR
jgi:tRNA (mo5U34)-methyltransferase